jgi:hypothetical protein
MALACMFDGAVGGGPAVAGAGAVFGDGDTLADGAAGCALGTACPCITLA